VSRGWAFLAVTGTVWIIAITGMIVSKIN